MARKKIVVSRSDFEKILEADESPDLSHLGQYSDAPAGWYLDRWMGDVYNDNREVYVRSAISGRPDRTQYRYFIFAQHLPYDPEDWSHVSAKAKKKVIKEHGSLVEASLQYAIEDYKRYEAMNNGEWQPMLVGAKVEVEVAGTTQVISSGVVGGVESDDEDNIGDIFTEQSIELEEILKAMGIFVTD